MFDSFFGRAKDLAIVAVVAIILAIAGVAMLVVAAAWQLSMWMTWPAALAVTGVGVLAIAAIALWIGTIKKKPEPQPEGPPCAHSHWRKSRCRGRVPAVPRSRYPGWRHHAA